MWVVGALSEKLVGSEGLVCYGLRAGGSSGRSAGSGARGFGLRAGFGSDDWPAGFGSANWPAGLDQGQQASDRLTGQQAWEQANGSGGPESREQREMRQQPLGDREKTTCEQL